MINSEIYMEPERLKISKTILRKYIRVESVTILDLKPHYREIIITTEWYCCKKSTKVNGNK